MPKIDADGTPINIEIEGKADAPVLMFSNSLGADLHMWDGQAEHFAKSYRVLRYDQRGHGKSGAPEAPYSIERLGKDVLAILNALEIPRVHFCGLSMGGMTGMWLARNAADRFNTMTFANTGPKSQTPDSWNARIAGVRAKGIEGIADAVLNVWFTKDFRERSPDVVARMRKMMISHDPGGYVGCCAAVRDMDQRWAISEIKVRSLIVAGRNDNATPLRDSEFMAARIAGSELTVLDAAHISNIEQGAAFNATLDKFLARN